MRIYSTPGLSYDDLLIAPDYSNIESRADISLKTKITRNVSLEIPIASSPMDTVTEEDMILTLAEMGGIGFAHRYCSIDRQVKMVQQETDGVKGAAVGAKGDFVQRAKALEPFVDVILIDVANGHHQIVIDAVKILKEEVDTDILVGNVATPEGTAELIKAGADGIRVGIGSGSHCTTRLEAGVGVPQATAVDACAEVARQMGVPICADGGIRYAGDAAKALGLGAHSVMLGSVLAGTAQTPGPVSVHGYGPTEKRFKVYRGMASHDAKVADDREASNIEGVATMVPFRGYVEDILEGFLDGIRSGISYSGAESIDEFHRMVTFVMVTPNANHLFKRNGM